MTIGIARLAAGHTVAIMTLWLCWALMAPIVAEKARAAPQEQTVCPWLILRHGVGGDLKTFTRVRDACSR